LNFDSPAAAVAQQN